MEIQIFPADGFRHVRRNRRTHPAVRICPQSPGAQKQQQKDNILCVIDEACSSCVQTNYEITNLCKGCVARACATNCPKNAIEFNRAGKAVINHDALHQLRHLPQQLPLPCHRLYARTVRRGLPRKGDYQGRTRRGAYR